MLLENETASQTAGPFVHIGLVPDSVGIKQRALVSSELCSLGIPDGSKAIEVTGQVFDGSGSAIMDAVLELWQADHQGHYPEQSAGGFRGWGRSAIDPELGHFSFRTIKPGPVTTQRGAVMAPHLAFWLVARGINLGLHTRMYFPEDLELHALDPVLKSIELKSRWSTLIASSIEPVAQNDALLRYRFDIVLQGDRETVFFDI
ncbi:MAG: protocatechuate 3,4-dioxygenase subunit alpha [Betaproteobacteria bacterium]|nr:protocatechuate 3,4-dioxygenase subunit alpha [Betaproteobacteria bacterium]NBO43248.1 protocatechuate 3,4-dioxygenase subunit alpha [Betaproteobacteria bacterium]NBP09244.1 protocatechuate 3,4-dioxygenase subunit alpha [Betaproteobacteria bacterium]NBP60612.1 protocatechuate 3,4-dioxygenase subunit alpha [Betaproteobacteria bacterium]NBQ07914.1 protocatechuate 3,4-dioxygenase subunit alpha [Betaproteobacteria bacterium]